MSYIVFEIYIKSGQLILNQHKSVLRLIPKKGKDQQISNAGAFYPFQILGPCNNLFCISDLFCINF